MVDFTVQLDQKKSKIILDDLKEDVNSGLQFTFKSTTFVAEKLIVRGGIIYYFLHYIFITLIILTFFHTEIPIIHLVVWVNILQYLFIKAKLGHCIGSSESHGSQVPFFKIMVITVKGIAPLEKT